MNRMLATALVVALLTVSCGTPIPSPTSSPTTLAAASPTPKPSAVASPAPSGTISGAFTRADLDDIVLGQADAPLDSSYRGPEALHPLLLPVWYLSAADQQPFRSLSGYVDAATADFRSGTSLFVSAALAFEDADAASAALAAYAAEARRGWGLTDPEPTDPGLHDESLLFSGPATVQGGDPGFYYFWRIDNLLLEAVGVGDVSGTGLTAMGTAVRDMALEMDRRAKALRAVDDCAASVTHQLAFEVPGMDDVEVTCDIVYKQLAGTNASLDLYLPAHTGAEASLPAVVFVHGNGDNPELKPIEEHWKRDQYTAARIVAALGYAAISFDYRGYDLPDRLADAEQDVLDLLAYVEANADDLHVDLERICLWSVSGGGLPTAWASIHGDPQPICTVLISAGFGGAPAEADPLVAMTAGMPPVFLAHGAQDAYADPESFVEVLTASGGAVTVETHPAGHGWESTVDPEQQRIIGLALDFVREYLGD